MAANLNWTANLFLFAGGALALAGLVLLLWALCGDRSRGRRRCPRCWYDMSGTLQSLRCSECGTTSRNERRLFRTRRRWKWALASLFVLMIGGGLTLVPRVQRDGWTSVVPTTALVLLSPRLLHSYPMLNAELDQRVNAGRLQSWQWRLLLRRYKVDLRSTVSVRLSTRDIWPSNHDPRYRAHVTRRKSGVAWFDRANLVVRLGSTWVDADEITAEFTRGATRPSYAVNGKNLMPWFDQTLAAGRARRAVGHVPIRVSIELGRGKTVVVDSWTMNLKYRMEGDLRDAMTPVQSDAFDTWLGPALAVRCNAHGFWLQVQEAGTMPGDEMLTLGIQAELLCNGRVVATGSALEVASEVNRWVLGQSRSQGGIFGGVWREWLVPLEFDPNAEWLFSMTDHAEMALRDVSNSRYWQGRRAWAMKFDPSARMWYSMNTPSAALPARR